MSRYAVVEDATGKVVNTISWDGVSAWAPPAGHTAVLDEQNQGIMGFTWTGGSSFSAPGATTVAATKTVAKKKSKE